MSPVSILPELLPSSIPESVSDFSRSGCFKRFNLFLLSSLKTGHWRFSNEKFQTSIKSIFNIYFYTNIYHVYTALYSIHIVSHSELQEKQCAIKIFISSNFLWKTIITVKYEAIKKCYNLIAKENVMFTSL